MEPVTLGIIISNRSFFPDQLVIEGKKAILNVLSGMNINTIILSDNQTNLSAVETYNEAKICAELFRKHRDKISGILISLPNFGDERGVADVIRMSGLDVPVFVHAWPDELDKLSVDKRRDSFCGKFSVCNNLRQYQINFSLGDEHVVHPGSKSFRMELSDFVSMCRIVQGLRGARIGSIGARTTAFKTVRSSEKLFEANGISIETIDLEKIFQDMESMSDTNTEVQKNVKNILESASQRKAVSESSLLKIAKMCVAINRWVQENDLKAFTIQCWPTMQDVLGVFPCIAMSLMSESLIPAACERDVAGAVSMYILQLASSKPSALFDWNNNYGKELDKFILFHCSNAPVLMLEDVSISYNELAATVMGEDKAYATYFGRLKPGPFTFLRVNTDDVNGKIRACMGQGELMNDPLKTFGGVGVAKINNLQRLLKYLCGNGYEHHVAITLTDCSKGIYETLAKYLGWDVYYHR